MGMNDSVCLFSSPYSNWDWFVVWFVVLDWWEREIASLVNALLLVDSDVGVARTWSRDSWIELSSGVGQCISVVWVESLGNLKRCGHSLPYIIGKKKTFQTFQTLNLAKRVRTASCSSLPLRFLLVRSVNQGLELNRLRSELHKWESGGNAESSQFRGYVQRSPTVSESTRKLLANVMSSFSIFV